MGRRAPGAGSALWRYTACVVAGRLAMNGSSTAIVLVALDRSGAATAGLIAAATAVPQVVAGPLVGAIPARVKRPGWVYLSAFLVFAATLTGIQLTLGRLPVAAPVGLALVSGIAAPLIMGGMTAVLSTIVPPEAHPRALGLDSATYNIASIFGPLAVAALAGQFSGSVALEAMAGCAALGAVLYLFVPRPGRVATEGERASVLDGLKFILRTPQLRGSTLATTLASLGKDGILPLTVALLAVSVGRQDSAGAVLLAAHAIGALCGSLAVIVRPFPERFASPALYGCLLWVGGFLCAAAVVTAFWPLVLIFFVAGLANGPLLTTTMMIRVLHSPSYLRGQVFTTAVGLRGMSALGAGVGGSVAGVIGAHGLALGIGLVQVLCVPVGLSASRERRTAYPVEVPVKAPVGVSVDVVVDEAV